MAEFHSRSNLFKTHHREKGARNRLPALEICPAVVADFGITFPALVGVPCTANTWGHGRAGSRRRRYGNL